MAENGDYFVVQKYVNTNNPMKLNINKTEQLSKILYQKSKL